MKLSSVLRVLMVAAATLCSVAASAVPLGGSTVAGAEFNLGLPGTSVTELGLGVLFASPGMAANDSILISIYSSEGGTLLGTDDIVNPFNMSVTNLGDSINLSGGLANGVGFATYQALVGNFDLTGATFNSFAPVVQTTGITVTDLTVLSATNPNGGSTVPEPGSLALLLAAGIASVAAYRLRART